MPPAATGRVPACWTEAAVCGRAGQRHESSLALRDDVVAAAIRLRPRVAEAAGGPRDTGWILEQFVNEVKR